MATHWCRRALDAGPGAQLAAPSNDGVQHARVVLDLDVLEDNGLLNPHTGTDHRAGTNGHIGTELRRWVHMCRWMNVDGGYDRGGWRCELLRLSLKGLLQVQRVGGHSGSRGLDLPPKVSRLMHKEPVAVGQVGEDVLLQTQNLRPLAVLIVLRNEGRLEVLGRRVRNQSGTCGPSFDRSPNGRENALCGEQVDTAIDQIRDVRFWLFNVVKYALRVGIRDDTAKVGGRFIADSCSQNYGFRIFVLEELQHLVQRE